MDKIKEGIYSYEIRKEKIGEIEIQVMYLSSPPISGQPTGLLKYSESFDQYDYESYRIIDL